MTPTSAPERPVHAGPGDDTAARLKARRQALGLTVERLAVSSGLATRTVQRIEHGGSARITTLAILARTLSVPLAWLVGGEK